MIRNYAKIGTGSVALVAFAIAAAYVSSCAVQGVRKTSDSQLDVTSEENDHVMSVQIPNYSFDSAESKRKAVGAVARFEQAGFDIQGRDLIEGYFDIHFPRSKFDQVQKLATELKVTLLRIDDGSQKNRGECNRAYGRMQALGGNPDEKYTSFPELQKKLLEWSDGSTGKYRHISKVFKAGTAVDGKSDILAVEITKNPSVPHGSRPTMIFDTGHHSRELMSVEVGIDMIEFLLTNYETDPEIKFWVDNTAIWVVPMVNPSGSNQVWSGKRMWRKNHNPKTGGGVDINRNYGYNFEKCYGGKNDPSTDTYRGPSGFSEPESKAMDELIGRLQPAYALSVHSTSEVVIMPMGCDGQTTHNRRVYKAIADEIAHAIPRDCSAGTYASGEAWELMYAVDGDSITSTYGRWAVPAFLIEVNDDFLGFQPGYDDWRDKTVQKVRAGWQALLRRLWSKTIMVSLGSLPADQYANLKIIARGRGANGITETMRIGPAGLSSLAVEEGMYDLTFELNGYHRLRIDGVKIGSCSFPDICSQYFNVNLVKDSESNRSSYTRREFK